MPQKAIRNLIQRYNAPKANLQKLNESANHTLDKIRELNVAPNPIHYTVIYEAIHRVDPYLASEVQKAIDSNNYSNDVAESLFTELFSQYLYKQLPTDEVECLLDQLLSQIKAWLKSTQNKEKIITNDLESVIQSEASPELVQRINDKVLPAIKSVFEDTHHLQEQVSLSTVEIKQLKQELEQAHAIAKTDELTNIPNRRGFNEIISNMRNQAMNQGASFALIILDIDYFKSINDEFGHLIGDSVLRYLAKQLQAETKGKDAVARIGGEEFVILLPNTSYDNALNVAENIRLKIGKNRLNVKSHTKPLKLTISAGVAIYQMGEEIDQLIERADKALYQAKNSGRNKVCGEGTF